MSKRAIDTLFAPRKRSRTQFAYARRTTSMPRVRYARSRTRTRTRTRTKRRSRRPRLVRRPRGRRYPRSFLRAGRPELKQWKDPDYETLTGENRVAQVAINSSGHYIKDVTPRPSLGTDFDDRVGRKISLKKMFLAFQFRGMGSVDLPRKLILEIWKTDAHPADSAVATQLWEPNIFLKNNGATPNATIYDTTCTRNMEHFPRYKCMLRRKLYIAGKDFSEQVERQLTKNIVWRGDRTIKFNASGDPLVRYFLIIRSNIGNHDMITPSTINIPVVAANTGIEFNYGITHYYHDA